MLREHELRESLLCQRRCGVCAAEGQGSDGHERVRHGQCDLHGALRGRKADAELRPGRGASAGREDQDRCNRDLTYATDDTLLHREGREGHLLK